MAFLLQQKAVNMRQILCYFIFIGCFITGCSAVARELIKEDVNDLKPTQAYVGMEVVKLKAKKIESLSKEERKTYLKKNPVPVIVGPDGQYYIIDHHHLSLALIKAGYSKLYIEIIADWSGLSEFEFWQAMEEGRYSYLYDHKSRPIHHSELPEKIKDLKDDPFRSLAYFVRKAGGYEKTGVNFAEFYWAQYFKKFISLKDLNRNKKAAFSKAVRLSHSIDAINLPGYIRANSCKILLLK